MHIHAASSLICKLLQLYQCTKISQYSETYLCSEIQIDSEVTIVMFQEIHHSLVEGVVFSLYVREVHGLPEDVLVERPCEVAIEQLVVVYRLGNHSSYELEIVEMVRIDVGQSVGNVCHTVARGELKQGIVWIEHLSGDNQVPLAKQTPHVLSLFPLKLDVQVPLQFLGRASVQLPERVLEDVVSTDMNHDVVSPHTVVGLI